MRTKRLPVAASDCAISFSWCGKMLSTPPQWMSKLSPSSVMLIAEHSMCQPGWPRADARVPADLVGSDRLPEREVADVLLGVVVGVDPAAGAGDEPLRARTAELAVRRERGDVEVVAAVGPVRGARLLEALDQVDHLLDVLGRARVVVRRPDAERFAILFERGDPRRGLLVERMSVRDGVLDDPVVDIGEVHHVGDRLREIAGRASGAARPRR